MCQLIGPKNACGQNIGVGITVDEAGVSKVIGINRRVCIPVSPAERRIPHRGNAAFCDVQHRRRCVRDVIVGSVEGGIDNIAADICRHVCCAKISCRGNNRVGIAVNQAGISKVIGINDRICIPVGSGQGRGPGGRNVTFADNQIYRRGRNRVIGTGKGGV